MIGLISHYLRRLRAAHETGDAADDLLRASVESMLDPQVWLEAVRDPAGRVVDFTYRSVNHAACRFLGREERELLGARQLEPLPNLEDSGLWGRLVQCLQDGQPMVLDDFSFFSKVTDDERRYDIRGTRAGPDLICLTWRDVTERFQAAELLAASQQQYRLITENVADVVFRERDGKIVWASPSVVDVLGAPPEYWIGRASRDALPSEDRLAAAARLAKVMAGEAVRERLRVISVDGVVHWADTRGKLFYDTEGRPDGFIVSLHLVDDEVAVEQDIEAAQRLLRASADSMLDPQVLFEVVRDGAGRVVDCVFRGVNRAACSYLGMAEGDLVGSGQLEVMPNFAVSGLWERFAECLAGGQPVVLTEFRFFSSILDAERIYDIRITRAGVDLVSVTWSDVTERCEAAQRLAAAEQNYRLLAENAEAARGLLRARADSMLDPQVLLEAVRDPAGRVLDFVYRSINRAASSHYGIEEGDLLGRSHRDTMPDTEDSGLMGRLVECLESGEPLILDEFPFFSEFFNDERRFDVRATRAGADLLSFTWRDVTERFEAAERLAASEQNYRLLAENVGDVVCHLRDDTIVWVSNSVEHILGAPPAHWIGRKAADFVVAADQATHGERVDQLARGAAVMGRARMVAADGMEHWVHMHVKPFIDSNGNPDGALASFRVIDDEVAAEQVLEQARHEQARADERYRRSVDNAAIGISVITTDGRFVQVNDALCQFYGYDAATLLQKTWQDLTAPGYLDADLANANAVLEGRLDSYRMTKQYIHADGHPIWGDLSVSCVRDKNGQVENFVTQVADITATVEANERNRVLAQQLQRQSKRLTAELESAAAYMSSIMPRGLSGKVDVCSRYLPSRELGGDSFNYSWIDDDHLLVYLIDVSGHGIEPALLSVSAHNLMRSGSFPAETLLEPQAALSELNRLFQMDQQGDHYFTMWYGVYQESTRTLRYASAGAPPAFAFVSATARTVAVTELSSATLPVGMFEDTVFRAGSYRVPPGCRILIFSDGASDLDLADGTQLSLAGFKSLATQVAGTPDWSLDTLIDELRALTPTGLFGDDCSLIQLAFD